MVADLCASHTLHIAGQEAGIMSFFVTLRMHEVFGNHENNQERHVRTVTAPRRFT
jgi:hypothetical protein